MEAIPYRWSEVAEDNPINLLTRRMVKGEQALVAQVKLAQGCQVATHSHVSEQIAVILSGRVRWSIGAPGSATFEEREMAGGEVLVLPSNVVHSVYALEDSVILDVLAPPGPMGVDSQGR